MAKKIKIDEELKKEDDGISFGTILSWILIIFFVLILFISYISYNTFSESSPSAKKATLNLKEAYKSMWRDTIRDIKESVDISNKNNLSK